jgi:4'-phosphopantetheinyl transferase
MPTQPCLTPPGGNQVHLWYATTAESAGRGWHSKYAEILSPDERERHDRFVFDDHRQLFLVAHALVRTTLAHYTGVEPAQLRFAIGTYGKPALASDQNPNEIRFNLSHSRGLAICGVATGGDLGVDCENIDREVHFSSITHGNFSSQECAAIEARPRPEQAGAFYEFWTLKEAFIKAVGRGLSIPLSSLSFSISAGGQIAVEFTRSLATHEGDGRDWYFHQPRISATYKAAVALRSPIHSPLEVTLRNSV